jgi:hypothetical protein
VKAKDVKVGETYLTKTGSELVRVIVTGRVPPNDWHKRERFTVKRVGSKVALPKPRAATALQLTPEALREIRVQEAQKQKEAGWLGPCYWCGLPVKGNQDIGLKEGNSGIVHLHCPRCIRCSKQAANRLTYKDDSIIHVCVACRASRYVTLREKDLKEEAALRAVEAGRIDFQR